MLPNQEANGAGSHGEGSKPIKSELKTELEIKECSTIQYASETCGEKEMTHLDIPSQDDLDIGTALSESKPELKRGITAENVRSNLENDLNEPASNVISDHIRIARKERFYATGTHYSAKKRAHPFDVQRVLGSRERNLHFQSNKRSRFSFDDNSRTGRIDDFGPIQTNDSFSCRPETTDASASIVGMFDDAEGDQTFNLKMYKKSSTSTSTIRPDLVAAILGSPPKHNSTVMHIAIRSNLSSKIEKSRNDQEPLKVTNKKRKKKSTEKERMAAVAFLDGEIDLLRVLPKDDCYFLGEKCFIFTLQQLQWVLNEDVNSQNSSARREARETLARNLKGSCLMINESKKTARCSTNQNEHGQSTPVCTSTFTLSTSGAERISEDSQSKENRIANETIKGKPNKDIVSAKKMEAWKTLIQIWKPKDGTVFEKGQFPLVNGPMSIFFPVGTLQFMESINVKVLFDFLCLKKTESGRVVEMFQAWRGKCGLKGLNLLPLAKHLTGINARIEASLKMKLDPEKDLTKWISGPMVVLSGAAKEFLVDYSKFFSGTQFIETKTKTLADQFSDWRSKTGLPALKGSGNVAMVSAWKTQVKDELELEKSKGKVIREEEIGDEIESEAKVITLDSSSKRYDQQSKRRKVERPKSKTKYGSLAAQEALNSAIFFSKCFSDDRKVAMFKSVGITTGQKLLDADKGKNSDLLKAVIQLKSEENKGKEIQISSCVSLLYDWSSRVKKRINDIEKVEIEEGSKIVDTNRKSNGNRNWKKKGDSMNPFDALSTSSKEFLVSSMDIHTASDFLATRTTDIANAFIKWRKDKAMSTLKGLGAVASISGWKKLVRTKAASVGDLGLAELNRSRNTRSVVGKIENTLQQAEYKVTEYKNQLGALGTLSNEAKEILTMELKSKTNLSVLSCTKTDIFHFELETRNLPSEGFKWYLRYLGSDPESVFDLTVDMNFNNEKECIAIEANLDEKIDKISGRKPYDSLTHGTIELGHLECNPGVQPKDQENDFRFSLEELIRIFVLRSKISCKGADHSKPFHGSFLNRRNQTNASDSVNAEEPRKMFNVFEVLRKGKKSRVLYLVDPIERGQSVELRILPLNAFDKSLIIAEENGKTIRNLIQDRLRKVPVELLLEVLRFLKTEVAALDSNYSDLALSGIDVRPKNEGQSSYSSLTTKDLVLARRRIHWVAVKVYENLQSISTQLVSRHISTDLLWTELFVDKFRDHPGRNGIISESISEEIRQELKYEFIYRQFNGFANTMDLWCPLASTLFKKIADLFATFSSKFGGACVGKYLTSELSCLVSTVIVELRKLSHNSQNGEMKDLSEVALLYQKSTCHDSNVFPSFEQITQKVFLQPYIDAMLLCNEPISMLDSIKEARIVATKRICALDKIETTRFKDLHDTNIHEENNIDVRWYVDTQILAVALSAIRCGISISTPEDTNTFFHNIKLQILEAAHTSLLENNGEGLTFEDFDVQQRVTHSILRSEVQKAFGLYNRSSATPSSMPFFFGLIWPLLRDGGWKLVAGNFPKDVSFMPPVEMGTPNRIHHPKDSLARQRSQLAKETSSFGLGYIPRLTKRLLLKCLEKNDTVLIGHESDLNEVPASPPTKFILEAFSSSLLLDVEKIEDSANEIEEAKVKGIVIELLSLFNKLAPLTFEKGDKYHVNEGKQWCDVLDCRYLFKFLIIIPDVLLEAELPAQQYKRTIIVIHELLIFLSKNNQRLFHEWLNLPNEQYCSESNFQSILPLHIKNFSRMRLGRDLGKSSNHEESEDESDETIRPADRVDLTDFVAIVMGQTIIRQSTLQDSNRQGRYRVGHPCIVCRHCLGLNGGKYFYGSYESIASATTIIEKHILRCTKIDKEVKQEVMNAKIHHSKQRKNLPFGAQGAFFVRLYDRIQRLARSYNESSSEPGAHDYSVSTSLNDEKHPLESENGKAAKSDEVEEISNISRVYNSHLDVMDYIQSTEPWKSKKPLAEMISRYYNCLDYGGRLCSTKRSRLIFSSEWLYSKLAYKN